MAALFAVYIVGYPISDLMTRVLLTAAAAFATTFVLQFGPRILVSQSGSANLPHGHVCHHLHAALARVLFSCCRSSHK